MKSLIGILTLLLAGMACTTTNNKKELKNPVFVFNNAFNKQETVPLSFYEQALLLKELGFDGIEHREISGITELKDALQKQGLKIYADYLKIDIDQAEPYLPEWKEVIPKLKGTGIILWCHIHSKKYNPSDEAADERIVPVLQELADLAGPGGVRIAIYHHVNFLAEKADDSFRLAQKTNRENVGSVFNLCHFLKTDSEENLVSVINLMLPKLFAVSVSGADGGNTQQMDWNQLIQPLGEGTFDVYRLVELLADKGYTGPIGIQCYRLNGSPEDYLKKSSETWKSFRRKYALPVNTLTTEEKKEGWQLLFDGKSTDQWRAINQDTFPETGWKTENGELIANGRGGAESGSGGDVITKKQYSNFILKWEWKMVTKGGNSGLKYYVHEGIGDHKAYGYGLEYQILDDQNHPWMLEGKMQPNDYHTLGSLYEIYPAAPDKRPSPLGLWNESMIVSRDKRVEHWLNGKKILEYERGSEDFKAKIAESKFRDVEGFGIWPEGHVLLQDHGSTVHFRNIKIKE
ncbi:family 16 glycoside hydrolase [Gaoshiqia sp. Z1-71]|uniref:family 16 glycoside hydrolase n=1 Tax=Gaoshiqia hydrogeniformans TaxID=3290090 RepID=UPI003BF8651B